MLNTCKVILKSGIETRFISFYIFYGTAYTDRITMLCVFDEGLCDILVNTITLRM